MMGTRRSTVSARNEVAMHVRGARFFASCVGFALALFGASLASAQVRPRIVIAFDTSGSMALDFDGLPTFGDGSGGALNGIDTNCDGLADDSRIFGAKEAMRNMLLSFGDVDWALARFQQTTGSGIACRDISAYECNAGGPYVTSYGNPTAYTGPLCYWDWASLYPAACRPTIRTRVGGNPAVPCINYVGTCGAGADVLVGFPDLGPFAGLDNTYAMLRWMDNRETMFSTSTTAGNFCAHATTGDCELRAEGGTPLGGVITGAGNYITPIRAADAARMCRPYSVLLITDGVESCGGNPSMAASTLFGAGIRTYVVGMAIDPGSRTTLNAIASSGGTDAGAAGGDTAFFADDSVTLSAGLADIVRRSVLVEICNGLDDDCDTRIDEGVTNACGTCGAIPAETCNGADDDCDTRTDEGTVNACGACGATPTEICNGFDDNCNGAIDEGMVCGTCVVSTEICDNLDNDCDTRIDETVSRSCGVMVGRCTIGTQICTAGSWGACSGVGAIAETCNNVDDDCNGVIDGMTQACGSSTGACRPGLQTCTAGAFGACVGSIGATAETCNGIDDNCNGVVDDGASGTGAACGSSIGVCRPGTVACVAGALTCTGGTSGSSETCNASDDDCDGRTDESIATMGACGSTVGECRAGALTCVAGSFSCVGARGPTAELCNGRDDNCSGASDEGNPGGGVACGTATGACELGTSQCVAGALVCMGGTGPTTETCNTIDDDCDNLVDEGNPGGGGVCGTTDEGLCERGALACVAGAITCLGSIGPSMELCDGLDNDCDMLVDEGNPEAGGACGSDTGECVAGMTTCTAGMLTCLGAVGPGTEVCNGLDEDCDSNVDEDLGVGEACGTDTGECSPGFNRCIGGAVVCDGAIDGMAEECNALDDDCDGNVDEGLGLGDACGTDEGLCMAGRQMCSDGRIICVGGVEPSPESCDCDDNDCDSMTDEPRDDGSGLCPAGSECVECGCSLPCESTEFGFTCPTGRSTFMVGSMCFCVAERCSPPACAGETHMDGAGTVACAPDVTGLSSCVCRNNECTFPCDGVVCPEGTACDPRNADGRCVEDNCRGLGCPGGEVCDTDTGECVSDPCAAITCDAGEACRDGTCEASCATVTCDAGERCERGVCVADLCDGVACAATEVCDPASGDCVVRMCGGVTCPGGTSCDPVTGSCVDDPCARLHCPDRQVCEAGECVSTDRPDAGGVDAGVGIDAGGDRILRALAAGGGGCFCAVPGAGTSGRGTSGGAGPLHASGVGLLSLALLGLVIARRRRTSLALVPVLACAWLVSGCNVQPYCFNCTDDRIDAGAGDTGAGPDSGADAGAVDSGTDTGPEDAGPPDGCTPDGGELCNAHDDDCDGTTDEGVDTNVDEANCGGCGIVCAPAGAFGECVGGECTIRECDVGRFDRDMDPATGCEVRCLPTATDDALCDLRDNDCDFMVDEDVDLATDPTNCGRCGHSCRSAHAMASCVAGECALGTCDPGFYDLDLIAGNGCEYSCVPATPPVEACNAADDDCDGSIDEMDPGGGGACGIDTGACSTGIEHCVAGLVTCTGGVSADVEHCDGEDEDCDGTVDELNPDGGRLCGSSVGTCVAGREVCTSGALVCTGATAPGTEACDGLDNDCDSSIDEMNPGGGGNCGIATGECDFGTLNCRGGVLACEGGTGPGTETCNGLDDDCSGAADEGNPGGGGTCGSDVGTCRPGTQTCTGGALVCVGGTGPGTETCNGLDDNCSGAIDEGNPGGGAACGSTVGACRAGAQQCLGGTLQCIGATGPTAEICNTIDDDCNGTVDDGFNLATDVNNCGMCGRVCTLAHAFASCMASTCRIASCATGWVDANSTASDGCELNCTVAGAEVCNGRDDDCDTRVDETLTTPSNFCNPNGVCTGTTAACSGVGGWTCSYPATYQSTETRCDGLDNDCDGTRDEGFGTMAACSVGIGTCRRTGTVICNAMMTGSVCSVTTPGPSTTETCNNLDDDCNGITDDNIPLSSIPTVTYTSGARTVRIMQYEASHADATSTTLGSSAVACSRPSVQPWTNVTWAQARSACCALNPGGTCGATGWNLCDATDWQRACQGTTGSCAWGYGTGCSLTSTLTCNGDEYDSSGSTGDQDSVVVTASPTFPMCYAEWGAADVYDMSGNVKEWTATETSPGSGIHQIRGGSYTNVEAGRTCSFSYTVGDASFAFPNTGFRCCFY